MEVYSHFLKLTSRWHFQREYYIKMTCIRFSFLVLRMISPRNAAFKEHTECLERDYLACICKWGKI